MSAVTVGAKCGNVTNNGRALHITVAYIKSADQRAECRKIVDWLKAEAKERKVDTVSFTLLPKPKPWNKSYPLQLDDSNRWLYRFNESYSYNPRAPHVEAVGAQDLAGQKLVCDLSTLSF
jgi:hypothetical protein